jgi:RHS repeat-associated protein
MNPYGYTGREIETNELYYYRARYYDADTQRFISVDPIGFASGDFNFYRYVGNSPMNFNDSYGLFPEGTEDNISNAMGWNSITRGISVLIPSNDISFGKDCITLHNHIIRTTLRKDIPKLGSQATGKTAKGKDSTHLVLLNKKAASKLKKCIVDTKSNKKSLYNSTADHLRESLGDYLKENHREGNVEVYGISILDGYHSVTASYSENENNESEFHLYDQGPITNFLTGDSEFDSSEDFDQAINGYLQDHQDLRINDKYTYPSKVEIYEILDKNEKVNQE